LAGICKVKHPNVKSRLSISEKMGSGTMTIVESVPFSAIHVDLDFGSMGTAKRWMSPLTEKMIGSANEEGLASLKQVSDIRAAEIKVEQATQQAA
jgi:hypothetical protein